MDALSRGEVGAPLSATHLRDLPRILRASHEPKAHPASRLAADGRAAAAATGVDLAARVKLDDRAAPGKSQRPLTVRSGFRTTSASRRCRRGARPSRGPSSTSWAWPSSSPASARRASRHAGSARPPFPRPGATCSRRSPPIPAWLSERSGTVGHALAREIKAAQAERLHAVRMQAARLLREVERSRGASPGAAGDGPVLARALCRPVSAEDAARWPLPRDPLLSSADALRGALLAAQIEAALAELGGGPWWRWKGAPAWLAPIWAAGAVASPEELGRAAGIGALSADPLARAARARFDAAGW